MLGGQLSLSLDTSRDFGSWAIVTARSLIERFWNEITRRPMQSPSRRAATRRPRALVFCTVIVIQLLMSATGAAQQTIRGAVVDTTGRPLPFVPVTVLTLGDKDFPTQLTDIHGQFSFSVPKSGRRRFVRTRAVGYRDVGQRVTEADSVLMLRAWVPWFGLVGYDWTVGLPDSVRLTLTTNGQLIAPGTPISIGEIVAVSVIWKEHAKCGRASGHMVKEMSADTLSIAIGYESKKGSGCGDTMVEMRRVVKHAFSTAGHKVIRVIGRYREYEVEIDVSGPPSPLETDKYGRW